MPDDEVVVADEVQETESADEPNFATVEMSDMTVSEHAKWLTTGNLPDRFTPKEQKDKKGKTDDPAVTAAKDKEKAEADAKAKEKKSAPPTQSSDTDEGETGAASETDTDKTNTQTSDSKTETPKDRAEKRKTQLSNEIVTLLNQSKDAKKELSDLQKQIAEMKSGPATTTKPEKETTKAAAERPKRPTWKEFDAAGKTWDEFEDAVAKHEEIILSFERKETERIIRETLETERKEREKTQTAAQVQEQNKKLEESWKKRINAVQKRLGDGFDPDVYFSLKVNPTTDEYLSKIDEGAEVWNYLATHADDAEEIRGLDAYETMERLVPIRRQVQDELKPKDKKPVLPRASKPPTDVGGKNAAPTDELDAAMEQGDAGFRRYMKEANRRDTEARKAR